MTESASDCLFCEEFGTPGREYQTNANGARNSHFKRVVGYARASDYVAGGLAASFAPCALLVAEKFAPSNVGKGGFAPIMRLTGGIGVIGGFLYFYQRSSCASLHHLLSCEISSKRPRKKN